MSEKRMDSMEQRIWALEKRHRTEDRGQLHVMGRVAKLEEMCSALHQRILDHDERLDELSAEEPERLQSELDARAVGESIDPELCFTLDAYLRLTHDPCAVCKHRITYADESPCFECNIRNWTFGDEMPLHFELHEDLK